MGITSLKEKYLNIFLDRYSIRSEESFRSVIGQRNTRDFDIVAAL
jgi:hypothetical protein